MKTPIEAIAAQPETAKMVILAGFCGAALSLGFVDGLSKKQQAIAIFSGVIMAHYLSPMIAYLFNEMQYEETIGFLVGLFGMSICSALFRAIQNSDIWALIVKRFSKGDA